MSFDYDVFSNDERTAIVYNKKKYSLEEALNHGSEEIKLYTLFNDFRVTIRTGFIRYGFHSAIDGEIYNGWNMNLDQTERLNKNELEVWIVEEDLDYFFGTLFKED